MAIIYTYPVKAAPVLGDTVIITDIESEDPENRTKQASITSIKTTMGVVDGTGTADTIPKWSDSNTLTDSFIITSGNNMSIPGYIARTGFSDTYFGYEAAGNSKSIALVSNGTQTVRSIHDGTNSYGWLGYDGGTRLYATPGGAQLQGNFFDIPKYIRHVGDQNSLFGFNDDADFIINVAGSSDQVRIQQNSIIMKTDSGNKISVSNSGVSLLHDRQNGGTTSDQKLNTDPFGIAVKGRNSTSSPGVTDFPGTIKFNNPTNNGYTGIQGPNTNDSTNNYILRLPSAVGTAGQVLALPDPIGSNPYQLQWVDNASGGGGSFAGNAASGSPLASAGSPLASGAVV